MAFDPSEMDVIDRRRVEAMVLGPMLRAFQAEFGVEKTNEIATAVITRLAREQGAEFAKGIGANGQALSWDWDRVNTRGGAIALGHPIGASGARIIVTLMYGLQAARGKNGLAVICHAGGGAVAMCISLQ